MRIYFERSGGFTGIILAVELDTSRLPNEEARQLEDMVASLDFFKLPEQFTSPNPGVDRFEYKITVSKGFRRHTVLVSESVTPEAMRPLLETLQTAARTQQL